MDYVGLICVRGGSKGLPGKNIREFCGRPLLAWAIEHAHAVDRVRRVLVSTDSEDIAAIARSEGAEVPFLRPAELAGDGSPEWLVWRHALSYLERTEGKLPDGLVVVPATAPLRIVSDIERCLDEYENVRPDVVITVTEPHRNPYFNMVTASEDGFVRLVIAPSQTIARRQDCPDVYDVTTVAYVARPKFVINENGIFDGKVACIHVPRNRAVDIDTLFDFEFAEFLMARREGKPS